MALWVAGVPGSAWTGLAAHDALVEHLWHALRLDHIAPPSIVLKYNALGSLPALLHAAPGAVWAVLMPLQLRGPPAGATERHRAAGRVALSAASVLMVGYALIDSSGLTADVADFDGHGGAVANTLDGLHVSPVTFNGGGLKVVAAWFVATGVMTFRTARDGDVEAHRAWAVRHAAAGLWVAAQRAVFAGVRVAQLAVLGSEAGTSDAAMADAFYLCAYATTFAYAAGAEVIARRASPAVDSSS